MLCYVFALLHNALYPWRIVIASDSYRFRLFAGDIAYDSYHSGLAGQQIPWTGEYSSTVGNVQPNGGGGWNQLAGLNKGLGMGGGRPDSTAFLLLCK
jgi:hypothetical protein